MLTKEEIIEALQGVKRPLIQAHNDIEAVANFIEARLQTEKEFADSRVYGTVCHALGILEEQITSIGTKSPNSKIMERKRIIVITPEERKYLQKMIGCSGVTVWEAVKYRKSNDIHKRIRKAAIERGNPQW